MGDFDRWYDDERPAPTDKVHGIPDMAKCVEVYDGRPVNPRTLDRYIAKGWLPFAEANVKRPDGKGPPGWAAVCQSLTAWGPVLRTFIGSAHAGAAQQPRPSRRKTPPPDTDTSGGSGPL